MIYDVPARTLLSTMILAACSYDASYEDCAINCSASTGCPIGLTCGMEGLCRAEGGPPNCGTGVDAGSEAGSDAGSGTVAFSSCLGLAASCGPSGTDNCCSTAEPIPGGTFFRSYDVAADGMYPSMSFPATISPFVLDKYEVTVGRFRKFVEAGEGTQTSPPATGAGAHAKIPGSGWDTSWNTTLTTSSSALKGALKCDATYQTWTDAVGANEELPINCVTWYEAMAFCIWDGGYLPTEAEWNFAAAGGNEQRAYPWSSPAGSTTIDCTHANYAPAGTHCVGGAPGAVNRVGSESPQGDGKWGQSDLVGNVWQYTLDFYETSYVNPCDDCANLTATSGVTLRGGGFDGSLALVRTAARVGGTGSPPGHRNGYDGIRCARLD